MFQYSNFSQSLIHPYSQAAEYLFVVGGGSRSTLQTTEIVSLAEGESIPECLNELADHPNDILDGSGGALPTAGKTKVFYNEAKSVAGKILLVLHV